MKPAGWGPVCPGCTAGAHNCPRREAVHVWTVWEIPYPQSFPFVVLIKRSANVNTVWNVLMRINVYSWVKMHECKGPFRPFSSWNIQTFDVFSPIRKGEQVVTIVNGLFWDNSFSYQTSMILFEYQFHQYRFEVLEPYSTISTWSAMNDWKTGRTKKIHDYLMPVYILKLVNMPSKHIPGMKNTFGFPGSPYCHVAKKVSWCNQYLLDYVCKREAQRDGDGFCDDGAKGHHTLYFPVLSKHQTKPQPYALATILFRSHTASYRHPVLFTKPAAW